MQSFDISINTNGEGFYLITDQIKKALSEQFGTQLPDGILTVFMPHTSCGLTISEAFDPSAAKDMEKFLQHLAPRNLAFIEHTEEGTDDSPSHMKSILIEHCLQIIVETNQIYLGKWQGIYLCEFRDSPRTRNLKLKFSKDL